MALTTLTFDTLRDRNKAALDRTGYTLQGDFAQLTAVSRTRVATLLGQRADLEELASTQSQREAFGIQGWHERFVLLRNVPDDLSQKVIMALPNSRYTRFQDAFSHSHQHVAPVFASSPFGPVSFLGFDFNTASLSSCLVAADKIPEKLAADLKLVEFTDDDIGKPLQRLEKKATLESINRLKAIFENAVQLQDHHHRLLRIKDDDKDLDGTILYTRTEENDSASGGITVQHFGSAYAAYRKTLHEGNSYAEEIPTLARLRTRITQLNRKVDREWKADTPVAQKQELQVTAGALLAEFTDVLKKCTAEFKELAHELLQDAISFEDKSGKTNPSAAMSKMVAAVDRLEKRKRKVIGIGSYNHKDQMVLRDEIESQECILLDARNRLQANAHILDKKLEICGTKSLSESQVQSQVLGVMSKLDVHPDDFADVTLKPLSVYSCKLEQKLRELGTALWERDQNAAKDAAVSMHVIGKFQGVRATFERVREHMADDTAIPLARVREFISQMKEHIDNHQILPGHIVEGYTDAFEIVCDRLSGIEERLTQISQEAEAVSTSELYKDLKSYVEECDLEAMVKELP